MRKEKQQHMYTYLLLIVHGDLDQDHGVSGRAHLLVGGDGVALVHSMRAPAKHLRVEAYDPHAQLLDEHYRRHEQAHRNGQPHQRHNDARPQPPQKLAHSARINVDGGGGRRRHSVVNLRNPERKSMPGLIS